MAQTIYAIFSRDRHTAGVPKAFTDRDAAEHYRAELILKSAGLKDESAADLDLNDEDVQCRLDILSGEHDFSIEIFETQLEES